MNQEKLARINELARKSKAEGLTASEREEQNLLRKDRGGAQKSAQPAGSD